MTANPIAATFALSLLLAGTSCTTTPSPRGHAGASAATTTAVASEGRHVLRGAQCLDPGMARSWIDIDDDTLLVDAGRYKYRIQVSGACSALDWSPVLLFRGDPVTGRVCGSLGDAILTRDYPCTIVDMQLLDKDQYKALVRDYEDARKARRAARRSAQP